MSNRQLNYLTEVTRSSQELFKNNLRHQREAVKPQSVDAVALSQQQDIYYQLGKVCATLFYKKVEFFSKTNSYCNICGYFTTINTYLSIEKSIRSKFASDAFIICQNLILVHLFDTDQP